MARSARLWPIVLLALVCASAGCMGPGKSGAQVLKPWTWFSHQEASATDRAESRVDAAAMDMDTAREDLLRAAQREAHRADLAIAAAPESRPVEVARDAAGNATAALDQALGPLSTEEAKALRERVAALLSEVAAIRQSAEQAQARDTAALLDAGRALEAAETKLLQRDAELREKQAELRTAFDRENALANQMRGQRWALIGATLLALALGAGWVYLKVTSGGLISTMVGRIDAFKQARGEKDPAVSELLTLLSGGMNRLEKKIVRKARVGSAP